MNPLYQKNVTPRWIASSINRFPYFKVLRESGVMYTRLEGTQRFISIREDDLHARFPGLLDVVLHATEPY